MANTKVDIGLDIGIASVGWAVADAKTHVLIKHGVRLFDTVDDKKDSSLKNETRRLKRHLRRQYSRIQTRKRDLVKLMVESGLVSLSSKDFSNKQLALSEFRESYVRNKDLIKKLVSKYGSMYAYEIRAKGVKSELTKEELIVALYWYASHRGHSYTSVDEKDEKPGKNESDFASLYKSKYKGAHPAEAQLDFFKNHFSSDKNSDPLPSFLKGSFNRGIDRWSYSAELSAILKNSSKLLPNPDFARLFLELFERQRDFSEGPGDEKSPTPYGRFFYKDETGKIVRREEPLKNLWDEKTGNCALYNDQPRAPRGAVAAQLFNLLNSINNTRIVGVQKHPFEKETRIALVRLALETKAATKKITAKMAKDLDLPDGADNLILPGNKKPKKGKSVKDADGKEPKFPELESFHSICGALPAIEKGAFDLLFKNGTYLIDNIYDRITVLLYQNRTLEGRMENLSSLLAEKGIQFNAKELEALAKIKIAASTHGYSLKALGQFIGEMLDSGANGEQIRLSIREKNADNTDESIAKYGRNYLKSDWVQEAIGVPTVRRSIIQTTVVINALFTFCAKNDYEIEDIVIEMAREKNNKEEREKYEGINEHREKTRQQIKERLGEIAFPSNTLILKVWLLEQQKCCDAYTGLPIPGANGDSGWSLEKILQNYEIDHVVPRSQSFDNSRSNLVLTSKDNNAKKGNRTPYQFLGAAKIAELTPKWTGWYRDNTGPFKDKKKLDRFLSQVDFSDVNNQEGFINRNLVDTQYTTKELLFALSSFLKNKGSKTKVKTINGKMTSFLRSRMNKKVRDAEGQLVVDPKFSLLRPADVPESPIDIGKDRTWHGHHAEDAYMIILINSNYVRGKAIEKYFLPNAPKDGVSNKSVDVYLTNKYPEFDAVADIGRDQLNKKMEKICFSRMVLRLQNTGLFNETIYKGIVRDNGFIQEATRIDILSVEVSNVKRIRKFFDGSMQPHEIAEKLYIYKNNRPLYDALKRLFDRYNRSGNENPFAEYVKDPLEAMAKKDYPYLVVSYAIDGKQVKKVVKNLTILGSLKKESSIVKAHSNGNSFYSSMNWVELHVYKNASDDLVIVPVNALYYQFLKLNPLSDEITWAPRPALANFLKEKGVKAARPLKRLRKGQVLLLGTDIETYSLKKGHYVYLTGFDSVRNRIEIKPLHKVHNGSQIYKKINFFSFIKSDSLGLRIRKID